MDRATIELYEAHADEWIARRSPRHLPEARAFAARVDAFAAIGAVADLGCGPGWYAPALPDPVVAIDASRAMLERTATSAPGARRVQADLEALPLRRGALRGAWARNSYVHLASAAVPAALADLHGALTVDAPVELTFFGGDGEGTDVFPNADLPRRFFSCWTPGRLADVITGAGFTMDELGERRNQHGEWALDVRAHRARTLPDTVGARMQLLVCGLNPSIYSADCGVGYARGTNRFWTAASRAGLVSRDRDPRHALVAHGIGMTDLVKRASVAAAELTADEYRQGHGRVTRLVAWLKPGAVCFVGLAGWRAAVDRRAVAGVQPLGIGGVPAYVMPSTSGLNARTRIDDLVAHLRAAMALAQS